MVITQGETVGKMWVYEGDFCDKSHLKKMGKANL
jgi:hypothetical protein